MKFLSAKYMPSPLLAVIFLDKAVLVTVQSDYLRTERSYSDVLSDPCIQMPFYCVNFKVNPLRPAYSVFL